MDRAAKFCFLSFVLLALMTSQAAGTNTQGFYWGLNSGDRLDYTYELHGSPPYIIGSLNERFYIIVNGLPILPDTVTTLYGAMCNNVTAYWANGSPMGYDGMWLGSPATTFFAIGNWPILAYLFYASLLTDYEVVDDPSIWGVRIGYVMGSTQSNVSWTLSKSDGATVQYSTIMYDPLTHTDVFHAEVNRVAVGGVSTPVLVSAAVISAEIIVAVLIIRRYRR